MPRFRVVAWPRVVAGALLLLSAQAAGADGPSKIYVHPVVLDGQGELVSWVVPQTRAMHFVATIPWTYLASVPVQANGLPTYYSSPTFDPVDGSPRPAFHNPAGLYAMLADAGARQYAYSGDPGVVALVQGVLDHEIAFGSTPVEWPWSRVPYASADWGAIRYQGGDDSIFGGNGSGDGRFTVEPDKIGELGLGYLTFWQLTGQTRYLDAALACADALAAHVRTGDATHSPWPFRVRADTGEVREEYTANALGPIKLLDALAELGLGDVAAYGTARDAAWAWVLAFPLRNGAWTAYFEDVPIQADPTFNVNNYIPTETARYLLLHPERDPAAVEHARSLLDLVEQRFGGPAADQGWGATAISEQVLDMNKMGSHTARWASVQALLFEETGDPAAREKAYRSFAWASYQCGADGAVQVGDHELDFWFSDGYGDYTRHFLAGMASVPEWAPPGEPHMLRSTSVVRNVSYAPDAIGYETFLLDSTETFRLPRAPALVTTGGRALAPRRDLAVEGYTTQALDGGEVVLRVRHTTSRQVVVQLGATPNAPASSGCAQGPGELGSLALLASVLLARRGRSRTRASAANPGRPP